MLSGRAGAWADCCRGRAIARCSPTFFRRELTTRYLGSVTGFAWALLHPLALLAVYHFVFTHIFRADRIRGTELPRVRRRGAVAVARRAGGIAARRGQHRRLCGHDPQGCVSARARRATRRSPQRSRCSSPATSPCSPCCASFGEPIHFDGLLIAVPVWAVLVIGVTGLTLVACGAAGVRQATSSTC